MSPFSLLASLERAEQGTISLFELSCATFEEGGG